MPNRWMDERDRRMRETWDRDYQGRDRERQSFGSSQPSGEDYGQSDYRSREDRSFSDDRSYGRESYGRDNYGRRSSYADNESGGRDRVFGERESGASYEADPPPYDLYRWRRPPQNDRGGRYGADYRNQDYDRGWSPGREYSTFGFGYDPRGAEYEFDRIRDRDEDRDRGGYTPNVREGRGEGGRNWWDKTRDQVTSWFGDHDAERRREWDAQMGGHRGRGPKGYRRSDERVSEDIHERLTDDPWIDASNIQITVVSGEVTLTGSTPDRETKHRAERIVESVSGVDHVQNNLRAERGGNYFTRAGSGFGDNAESKRQEEGGSIETGRGKGVGNA